MKLSELRELTGKLPYPDDPFQQRTYLEDIQGKGIDVSQLYQELEMESRYVDTHRDVSWNNTGIQLHSHNFYELIYCRSAFQVEYLVGARRYLLQQGDVVIVPPGVSHCPMLPEKLTEPYRRYVLWISSEFIETMTNMFSYEDDRLKIHTNLIRTVGTGWEFLGEMFRKGVREREKGFPGWEAAVAANTLQLLVQIQRALADSRVKPLQAEKPDLLDRVMGYVENNLGSRITLADTARQFYVSESTVSQLFRKKMGVSFHQCVIQRRLIAAKAMISENIPMEEVCTRVGFSDYSSFYRAFRQEYGVSPRQYRKLQQTQNTDA